MAEKKQVVDKVGEILTCPFCLGTIEEPSTLVCFHSFCTPCTLKLKPLKRHGKTGFECPMCSEFTEFKDIKQNNVLLIQILDVYNEANQQRCCANCNGQSVEARCADCSKDFCTECCKAHGELLNHKMQPLESNVHDSHSQNDRDIHSLESKKNMNCNQHWLESEKSMNCNQHPSSMLKLFCMQCHVAICVSCQMTDHFDHNTEKLSTAIGRVTPEVKSLLTQLEERIGISKIKCNEAETNVELSEKRLALAKAELQLKHAQEMVKLEQKQKEEEKKMLEKYEMEQGDYSKIAMKMKDDILELTCIVKEANNLLEKESGLLRLTCYESGMREKMTALVTHGHQSNTTTAHVDTETGSGPEKDSFSLQCNKTKPSKNSNISCSRIPNISWSTSPDVSCSKDPNTAFSTGSDGSCSRDPGTPSFTGSDGSYSRDPDISCSTGSAVSCSWYASSLSSDPDEPEVDSFNFRNAIKKKLLNQEVTFLVRGRPEPDGYLQFQFLWGRLCLPSSKDSRIQIYSTDGKWLESITLSEQPETIDQILQINDDQLLVRNDDGLSIINRQGEDVECVSTDTYHTVSKWGERLYASQDESVTVSIYENISDWEYLGDIDLPRVYCIKCIFVVNDKLYISESDEDIIVEFDLNGRKLQFFKPPRTWIEDAEYTGLEICSGDEHGNLLVCGEQFVAVLDTNTRYWDKVKFTYRHQIEDIRYALFEGNSMLWVLHGKQGNKMTSFCIGTGSG